MNLDSVRKIADAVLYEGYILYPYRASAQKNRSRWQFGVVMAPGYAAADRVRDQLHPGRVRARAQRPARGPGPAAVPAGPAADRTDSSAAGSWDEAVEREVEVAADAAALFGDGVAQEFTVEGGEDREEDDGAPPGAAGRRRDGAGG